ncbi:hypothetical protein HF1_08260 [Mycoplasma haemofelis str. Langford 1]|uniref:Uncharacterized protein n=2 Tax=Mycoplasma haemofelis TaxID=29501 RepID=F6FIW5_MYCHI|nr:hypothetical protein [Mycoplasma haemofelis]AEG73163.1 hypothetical protein MHF_0905 [Mycoplasma haemofelis Ohio2]CBY92834.1 hypothetical protein HF1_08260 [Mycoplasma haemofelis str. Langford 1]
MSKATVASLAGVGSVGGGFGAYKLYDALSTEKPTPQRTIADKLIEEKFSILSEGDEQHWTKIKEEYEKVKSNSSKVFSSNKDELKNKCKEALAKPESDSDYQKAKRWCVTPVTIKDYLTKSGLKAIETTGNTNESDWTKKVGEYEKQENESKRVSDLKTLTEPKKWEQLRDKCGTIVVKQNYEESFLELLDKSKLWCFVSA